MRLQPREVIRDIIKGPLQWNYPKKLEIVKFSAKSVSEHSASSEANFFFHTILRILNDHISKTKNRKIDFPFMLFTRTDPKVAYSVFWP